MADTKDPHASLWERFARHRTQHSVQYRLVHYGFWSSLVLLVLMMIDIAAPTLFEAHYVLIGMIYLVFQLGEIASRDGLNWVDALEGAALAFMPALFSLVVMAFNWKSGYTMLTSAGLKVMAFWFWISWICFGFGFAIALKILSTPYRRTESPAPRP